GIFAGTNGVEISGLCSFSLNIESTNYVTDNGVSAGSKITLYFNEEDRGDNVLVTGVQSEDIYVCGVADYKFTLDANGNLYAVSTKVPVIPENTKPVYNSTADKGFDTLVAAWNAASSGDVLLLNEPAVITERLNSNSRDITVRSNGEAAVTITRGEGYNGLLFLTNQVKDNDGNLISDANSITLENVVIDEENQMTAGCIIEAGNNGTVALNNVRIINGSTSGGQGLVSVKTNGALKVNGLVIEGSDIPEGSGEIFAGTNGVEISGLCSFSLNIESTNYVTDNGVAEGSEITLYFNEEERGDNVLVSGVQSEDVYVCGVADYKFTLDANGNLYAVSTKVPVIPENTKPVYNSTADKGFDTLAAAWNAASSGDVLVLNEPAVITERLNSNSRDITVTSNGDAAVTITRGEGYTGLLFLTNQVKDNDGNLISDANSITLENVVIDEENQMTAGCIIEAGNNGTIALNNVRLINGATENGQGLISVKNGGNLKVNGLVIEGSDIPEGSGEIFVGTNGVELSGLCSFSLYIESKNLVSDNGVSPDSSITVYFNAGTQAENALVAGVQSEEVYVCGVPDYKFTLDADGNMYAEYVVPEDKKPVYDSTSGKGFETLVEAWNAAENGDVLLLNGPAVITERLNSNSRDITVKSNGESVVTITRGEGYNGLLFLTNQVKDNDGNLISDANSITLENVVIDEENQMTAGCIIEAGNNGTIALNNVRLINGATENGQGLISVKNGGKLKVNGLVIEGSDIPEGSGEIFAGTNGVE
ncbi:MAG: hypothetical protein K2H49_07935, partial [Muribaculaceae bacterium]|nr:hypothetical protein [Muribaculaceae bacterium]